MAPSGLFEVSLTFHDVKIKYEVKLIASTIKKIKAKETNDLGRIIVH